MTKKTQKSQRRSAREYAVQALYQWQMSQPMLEELLQQFAEEHDFSRVDQDYWHNLVARTIEQIESIDTAIRPCVSRDFSAINPVELAILRVAACELLYSPEIPYRVVINEAIEIAKSFAAVDSHRFINAAIDKLSKQLHS